MTDRKHNCQKKKGGRKTVYHKTQYMKTIDPTINRSESLSPEGEESSCSAIDKLSIEIKKKIHYKYINILFSTILGKLYHKILSICVVFTRYEGTCST